MINFKRPMLAATLLPSNVEHSDINILRAMEKLRYPILVTLKKDGIRFIKKDILRSRTLKPIPNKSIRGRAIVLPSGYDGELYNPALSYSEIESIVMSKEHEESYKIEFHVLDWYGKGRTYVERCYNISSHYKDDSFFKFEHPITIHNAPDLLEYFLKCESENGEGICFRTPCSPYKQGRSTLKEQYLVKLARLHTSEAVIIGFEEQMENGNKSKRNAIGAMDRSSAKDNLYGKNTLGALWVRDLKTKQEFKIGTGFDDKTRLAMWKDRDCWIGRVVVYRHKAHGQKLLPRCASYKGLRKSTDIV